MAQNEKQWHPRFLKYMKEIVDHPNYKGLPIKKKPDGSYAWIATAKSEIGRQRIDWCIHKAQELGLTKTNESKPVHFNQNLVELLIFDVIQKVLNRFYFGWCCILCDFFKVCTCFLHTLIVPSVRIKNRPIMNTELFYSVFANPQAP